MASAVAAKAKTAGTSLEDGDLTINTNHAHNVTADTQDLRKVMAMLQDNDNADEGATVKLPTSTLLDDATIQLPSSLLPVSMRHKVTLGEKEGCSPAPATEGSENMKKGNDTKSSSSKSSSGKLSCTGGKRTNADRVGEMRGPLRALNVHADLAPEASVEQLNRRQTVDDGALEDFFKDFKGKENGKDGGEKENQQSAATVTTAVVAPETIATMTMTSAGVGTLASTDGLAERRETADPESLRYLLTLLKSPGSTGPASRASLSVSPSIAIKNILGTALAAADEEAKEAEREGGDGTTGATTTAIATGSSSNMTGRDEMAVADLTADTSQVERLIVDLETSLSEGVGGVTGILGEGTANFFVSPIARRRSSILARRLTADPELLEDLINELTGGTGQRRSTTTTAAAAAMVMTRTTTMTTVVASSSSKSPAAASADSRRTTASPADIGMLLADLPAEGVEEGGVDGVQAKKGRKSLRLAEQIKAPTGVPAVAGGTFSMSPPPLPPHGSSLKSLRSCLSSKKERPSQTLPPASPGLDLSGSGTRKSVVFGSPNAAYFNKGSPSNSLTPMTKRDVDLIFMRGGGGGREAAECESGVTAENTAILAQWNEDTAASSGRGKRDGAYQDEEEVEEEDDEGASEGNGKRRRVSKSPRPKRRQSLMLPAGSPGFMNYRGGGGGGARVEDKDNEEGANMGVEAEVSSIGGNSLNSLNEKLEQAEEKEQREEENERADTGQDCDMAMAMDVSPALSTASSRRRRSSGASTTSHEEEMPDLEDRSSSPSNFRALDQRTSSQLGIIGAAAAGGEGGVREETMELEQNLQSLMHNTRPLISAPVAGAARVDRTMELEGDLQALMHYAEGGRGQHQHQHQQQQRQQGGMKKAKMDINLGDVDSDAEEQMSQLHEPTSTTTFKANGEDLRISLDSQDNSFEEDGAGGDDATRTSILDNKIGGHTFSLSFAGNHVGEEEDYEDDDDEEEEEKTEGQKPAIFDMPAQEEEEEEEEEKDREEQEQKQKGKYGQVSKKRSSLTRSSTGSTISRRRSSGAGDRTSSPFAHIVVGSRLRGAPATAADADAGADADPESTDSLVVSAMTGERKRHPSTPCTSSPFTSSEDRHKRHKSLREVSATALAEAEEVSTAMPIEFDWQRVVAFQQERGNIMRLVGVMKEGKQEGEKEGMPVALLRQAVLESLLENCESVALNQLQRGDEVDGSKAIEADGDEGKQKTGDKGVEFDVQDVEALQEAMLAALTLPSAAKNEGEGGTEDQAVAMKQLIAAVAPRLELEWQSLESQLLQMVRMRVTQEMGTLKKRSVELAADMERVSAIEGEVQEAIGVLQAKCMVLRAQRKDADRQHRLEELEARQREASERAVALAKHEEALKMAVFREKEAAKTRDAARQMISQIRAALTEKNREAEAVQAIEEKGRVLRGLFLWQPLVLTNEELSFACAHPDGSRTEVRLLLKGNGTGASEKVVVTDAQVTHMPPAPGRNNREQIGRIMCGPNSRTLLLHTLRSLTIFTSMEPPPPPPSSIATTVTGKHAHALWAQGMQCWSWKSLCVDVADVPGALARLERLLGRTHLLMEAVARLEAVYPCTLVVGEAAVRSEAWVEECLYGACTTCRFDHGQSGGGGAPHIRLPHCSAVLVATVQPSTVKRGVNYPAVQAKFLLSLSFLASIPLRVEPALDASKLGCLQKVEGLLTNRLGVPPHHPINIQARKGWQAADMLVEACRVLKEEGGL